ncbi:MAG TPA: hypothetical protein VJN70_18390 [Gemmatimonadaceae bacterium]|nr:hypothetical protein [Gemmatimonadaceae bacterium]
MRRRTISVTSCGLLFASLSATRVAVRVSAPEACTLLTAADASKALEASSFPGKRLVESSPDGCVWSNDPAASDSSRRVVLNTHTLRSFQAAKHPAITTIKIEPVAGIGDEAFYQIYPTGGPFLWAIKGNTAISIRILTRLKPSPFTAEQEKSKEVPLGKAAVSKL